MNPSPAGPMLILICSVNPGTVGHAGPLRAKPAYQVSPVSDHSCHFYPAAHKFAGTEPSGWQKDLGQIFVHWVSRCLSPRPIPPHTPTSLLSLFPFQSPFPLLLFPRRSAQASPPFPCDYSTPQTIPPITGTLPLWEQELFSESLTTAVASAQHVGQTHPVWRLLSWTAKAVTARPDAPPGPKVNKTDMMLPLVSPS